MMIFRLENNNCLFGGKKEKLYWLIDALKESELIYDS